MAQIRPALVLFVLLTLLTGGLYPAVVTLIGSIVVPSQANGSLIERNGKVVGSALVGQQFSSPKYFWSRLSATAPVPYNGASSSGANLAVSNPKLTESAAARISSLQAADPGNRSDVPVDLITSSGSGLDPHISVAAAMYQLNRVARERGVPAAQIEKAIKAYTEERFLGVFGDRRVNVLRLNLALDEMDKR